MKAAKRIWPMFFFVTFFTLIYAQDPCQEAGPGCRPITQAEKAAFQERILAVKALLPVPDPAVYEDDGMDEAGSMPFIADAAYPEAVLVGLSWPEGCFPPDPHNTLYFAYRKKPDGSKTAGKTFDPIAAMAEFENRIEVSVRLLPHSYLTYEFDYSGGTNIEKNDTFLYWETGEDNLDLHMIFGARTGREEETMMVDQASPEFAPVKSMELLITGPKADVLKLKKQINRQALAGLIGPVIK
ncbi:MAG: hypothetical protein WAN36_08145 [Calditrichia bacterium]